MIKIFFLILSFSLLAQAAEEVRNGLIASTQGFVQVLVPVDETQAQSAAIKKVIFEGHKYAAQSAKVGMMVKTDDMIMTGDDGKAKIILEHGDVLVVPSGSAVSVPGPKKKEVHLIYGKVRAIIDKDGPLSGLEIKTPTVTAGVRGTDLFVSFDPGENTTHVEVLRGEVKVEPKKEAVGDKAEDKALIVKTGEIGIVTVAKLDPAIQQQQQQPPPQIHTEIRSSSVEDLKQVKRDSAFDKKATADLTPETKVEVEKAEAQAVDNIIKDVKRYDTNAGARLSTKKYASIEDVNSSVLWASYKSKKSTAKMLLVEQIQNGIQMSCQQEITSEEAVQYAKTLFKSCVPGQMVPVNKGCATRCLKQVSGSVIGQ